jgi:protein tyrosine phosphatase
VRQHYERVAPNKEEVALTNELAAELLQLLVLPERHPVYVHCLDGVGVTGLLIM